jgi:hypothetical protein
MFISTTVPQNLRKKMTLPCQFFTEIGAERSKAMGNGGASDFRQMSAF